MKSLVRVWIGIALVAVGCSNARSSPGGGEWEFLGLRNLTEEQRVELDTLRRDWQRETMPRMARIRALNVEIHTLLAADAPDIPGIQERLDQVTTLLSEIQKAGLDRVMRLRKVLTPAQNREFQDRMLLQGDAFFALEGLPGLFSPTQPLPIMAGPTQAPSPGPGREAGPGSVPSPGPAEDLGAQTSGPASGVFGPVVGIPPGPPGPVGAPPGPAAEPGRPSRDDPGREASGNRGPRNPRDPWAQIRDRSPDDLRPCDGTPGPCRAACEAAPEPTTKASQKK